MLRRKKDSVLEWITHQSPLHSASNSYIYRADLLTSNQYSPSVLSIWLRGMRKFHVIASVNQYHYNLSGCCILCHNQPLVSHRSLHLSIHSSPKFTYLYFPSFLSLYHTCLCLFAFQSVLLGSLQLLYPLFSFLFFLIGTELNTPQYMKQTMSRHSLDGKACQNQSFSMSSPVLNLGLGVWWQSTFHLHLHLSLHMD